MFENKVFPHRTVNMRKREINCYDVFFCAKLLADAKDQFGLCIICSVFALFKAMLIIFARAPCPSFQLVTRQEIM